MFTYDLYGNDNELCLTLLHNVVFDRKYFPAEVHLLWLISSGINGKQFKKPPRKSNQNPKCRLDVKLIRFSCNVCFCRGRLGWDHKFKRINGLIDVHINLLIKKVCHGIKIYLQLD